ncbi:MAG TPA: cyanophycinase [Actinomycetales bacterium]|nr:cyanophycinase [Actinomycetales bacterium]
MPTPAPLPDAGAPGPLVVIGGAEDKSRRASVLRRFVALAGGRSARIVVLPTASSVEPEMVEVYTDVLTRLGAANVRAVRPTGRRDADSLATAVLLRDATGVFLTGGNQLKLAQWVAGTALGGAIHEAHRRGAVIGGTSAGASIMSTHMISLGGEGVTPRQRSSQLTAGLGLIDGVVVDQHFDQRSRHGRLMSVVATSPSLLGVGIDEDTAAVVTEQRWLEVVGSGSVFVVDAQHAVSDAHEARRGAPLLLSGAVVHSLPSGARFDLHRRELVSFTEKHGDRPGVVPHADRDEARTLAAQLRAQLRRPEDE